MPGVAAFGVAVMVTLAIVQADNQRDTWILDGGFDSPTLRRSARHHRERTTDLKIAWRPSDSRCSRRRESVAKWH